MHRHDVRKCNTIKLIIFDVYSVEVQERDERMKTRGRWLLLGTESFAYPPAGEKLSITTRMILF